MPVNLLDATSSPSNRVASSTKVPSCSATFIDEATQSALYAVSGDDTAFVIAPLDQGDPWDEASLEARLCYTRPFANSPGRRTDYRIVPFHGRVCTVGQLGEPSRDRGTTYDAAAFQAAAVPETARLGDLAAALGRQIATPGAMRGAVEALRLTFRALTQLDAEQVRGVRESIEALQSLLAGAEGRETPARAESLSAPVSPRLNPWADKLLRLKELASLNDAELAALLGVSRSNVQGWLHRGQGMRPVRQRHLLDALKVLEDAHERLRGDEQALRQALLTPVGPAGQTPLDYLTEGKYLVVRGYLQGIAQQKTARRAGARRAPIRPAVRLPESTRSAALEALSPSPRVDADSD